MENPCWYWCLESLLILFPEWLSSLLSCTRKMDVLGRNLKWIYYGNIYFSFVSSILIMVIYYFVFLIMFLFNLIFNKERPHCSLHYWIGSCITNISKYFNDTISGLFINSLTSILTFNSFSFLYLSKDKKRFRPPEGTLVKQMIYFIIFILINIG